MQESDAMEAKKGNPIPSPSIADKFAKSIADSIADAAIVAEL